MMKPNVVILAGPNGAGKSTLAEALIEGTLGGCLGLDPNPGTGDGMKSDEIDIPEILKDRVRVQNALRGAVQKAIRLHKLLGRPIYIWRDGQVVQIPPDAIEVDNIASDGANSARHE